MGLLQTIEHVNRDMRGADAGFRWGWREGHKAYGWGIACAYKNTGLGGGAPDRSVAEIEVYPNSIAEVRTSSADMGQGLSVVLAQIAAEELGLPVECVRVLLSDTDLTPDGGPTTASRQTYVSGNAARYAAATMREALASVAAERMSVPPEQIRFEDGKLRYNGSTVAIGEVVNWMHQQGQEAKVRYAYDAPQTQPLGTGGDMHFAFSYATQAALIEVDLETGAVKVLRIIAANDVGRAINPKTLNGQVQGGIMMGMGNCLTEEYIVENGVPGACCSRATRSRASSTRRRSSRIWSKSRPARDPTARRAWARSRRSTPRPPLPTPSITRPACASFASRWIRMPCCARSALAGLKSTPPGTTCGDAVVGSQLLVFGFRWGKSPVR